MAENGENIREMLAGFNAMQAQLGLLPPQTAQMPMGVQLNPPPPPMQVMHPGQFAAMAVQQHQAAAQNTIQFAQMTRYQPPPSAPSNPFTWERTTQAVAAAQFNPQMANFMSGGQAVGMPSPLFSTAPQFAGYRPSPAFGGGQPFIPNAPHIFNPMSMPGAMFQQQYLRDYQISRAQQGNVAAGVLGGIQGGFELAGGIGFGAIGGALGGPLRELAGNWVGTRLGGFMGNMVTGPIGRDMMRGRQLQDTTAPFMVAGAQLDPFTGQGLSRQAGLNTAIGLRRLTRDFDFTRQTGFNTADVMQLTQGAADQGLLATAQSGEEIVRRMKDISKAIRVITQLTGDPDVKAAMRDLGNMRNMGFEGLPNQMAALSNRAAFARMAGVSQSALEQNFGMPGALMAQNVGLAGATGYQAGIAGAGMANIAISGGAFSDLQLSRAGGRQGVAQTLALSQIGAQNQNLWMAAALVNRGGKLDFDMDAYRAAQRMSPNQVAAEASRRLGSLNISNLSDIGTQLGEFKDRAAQQTSPVEAQLNAIRQIENFAAAAGGISFGAAATRMGLDPAQARTLELLRNSPGFWRGQVQQLDVQDRSARDRRFAERAQFRRPGLVSRMGQGISDAANAVSDWSTGWARDMLNDFDANAEQNNAFDRGEVVRRNRSSELIRSQADADAARGFIEGGSFADLMGRTGGRAQGRGGLGNLIRSSWNGTVLSDDNRREMLVREARGFGNGVYAKYLVGTPGSADQQNALLTSVGRAGRAATSGIANVNSNARLDVVNRLRGTASGRINIDDALTAVGAVVRNRLSVDGNTHDGAAMTMEQMTEPWVQHLKNNGWTEAEARKWVDANADQLVSATITDLYPKLSNTEKRAVSQSQEISEKLGATTTASGMQATARADLDERLKDAWIGKDSQQAILGAISAKGSDMVARAALRAAAASGTDVSAQLADLNRGKSVAEVSRLNAQADVLYGQMDEKSKTSLLNLGKDRNGDVVGKLSRVATASAGSKAAQAISSGLRTVNEMIGMSGEDFGTTFDKLAGMSDEQLAATFKDESLVNAIKTYKKDKGKGTVQAETALLKYGALSETSLSGGGPQDEASKQTRAELEERAKNATGPDQTMQQFSDAVGTFATAASNLQAYADTLLVTQHLDANKQANRGH